MKRILAFAGVFLVLTQTCASAESWVSGGKVQYDADSVYVDESSGFLHFNICMEDKCVAGNADQLTMYIRYDCDARMESTYDPYGDRWTDAVAYTGELETTLCAKRASLPRHQ